MHIVLDLLDILVMHKLPHGNPALELSQVRFRLVSCLDHGGPVAWRVSFPQLQMHLSIVLPSRGAGVRNHCLRQLNQSREQLDILL